MQTINMFIGDASSVREIMDDFGNKMYVLRMEEPKEPMSKKDICVEIMKEWIKAGKELKRSEIMKVFMADPRLKFEKPTANTYFYSAKEVLEKAKLIA